MKQALIFLTDGFEEIEAVATMDIMRRGGVRITSVSLTDSLSVTGGHGIAVSADKLFDQADYAGSSMLILPGGTVNIDRHDGLKKRILEHLDSGRKVAAICAAPMVLGGMGLLDGKRATCYPGFEKYLYAANLTTDAAVVVDGNITTGRGPGLTFDFALSLLSQLEGAAKADEVAKGLLLRNCLEF